MKIFQKVHCKAYLKKEWDGISLVCTKNTDLANIGGFSRFPAAGSSWREDEDISVTATQMVYENGKWDIKDIKNLSSFEGEYVDKRYRKRIEEEFDGFLVGITYITTTGRIGTDCSDFLYYDCVETRKHLTKETHQEKVGVVYFKNNAKRYVLLDDMNYEL